MNEQEIKTQIANYYDSKSDVYSELYLDNLSQAENKIVQDLLLKYLPNKDAKVLDLGTGHGLAADLVTWKNFTGIDISLGMSKKAKRNHPDHTFLTLDMENLPFDDRTFDYIISLFGSFSHSLEPQKSIKEIYRTLKPNGKIFIMVYSQYSLHNLASIFNKEKRLGSIAAIQEYSIRNLDNDSTFARFYNKKLLTELFMDFSNIKVIGMNAFCELGPVKKMIRNHPKTIKCLAVDYTFTKLVPNLGHSLVVVAEKK